TRKYLVDLLSEAAGQSVKLDLVIDATLQAPPEPEFFLGLQEPEPASRAPEPQLVIEPEPAAPANDESFYQDPLIQKAMEIFKAKLVSP
ncbi:MAG: polymerase subunit gamma/tau, partial [Verrucomicrobiaceae bacterium]|nr:polymerase subunit gamma/tau [Verrucomicrobiaceae bacterium]